MDEVGHRKILLPIQDYFFSLPGQLDDVGLTNFYNDADGVLRRLVTALPDAEGDIWPTFAALLAGRAADGKPPAQVKTPAYIRFAGPPGTFSRLSLGRLRRPGAEQDPELKALKDKVVIVALETRLQDIHLTPYARSFLHLRPYMMSGPEVHANIVETLLTGRAPRPGEAFRCPEQAATLAAIADSHGEAFYRGRLAEAMAACSAAEGGAMTLTDLASHRADWVEPVSVDYRGARLHEIPPNGQGIAALIALGVLHHFEPGRFQADSADSIHLQIEAMKSAFAEVFRHVVRNRFGEYFVRGGPLCD